MEVVTEPKLIVHMFYVAMRKNGSGARASCVADHKQVVKEFFRDYAGHEIRYVNLAALLQQVRPERCCTTS